MWSRLILLASAVFWVVMSVLLWRVEYGKNPLSGIAVEPERVWKKILTSPDSSSLIVLQEDKRIGFCHLITSVADQLNQASASATPEGMVSAITGYQIDLSGSAVSGDGELRTRFDGVLHLNPDYTWSAFRARIVVRPVTIEVSAKASEDLVRIRMDTPEGSLQRMYRIADLTAPDDFLADLIGPAGTFVPALTPLSLGHHALLSMHDKIVWTAQTDIMTIGQTATQVYVLQTRILERYDVVLIVSRAGEILRAELPGSILLVNEAMASM